MESLAYVWSDRRLYAYEDLSAKEVIVDSPVVMLIPIGQYDPDELGPLLGAIVRRSPRMQHEFPNVAQGYCEAPVQRVRMAQQAVSTHRETRGVYVVEVGGRIAGLASYWQSVLAPLWRPTVAEGPLIATWLDGTRPNTERCLAPQILSLLAGCVTKSQCTGRPWTVVRPSHGYAMVQLRHLNNGFGGFVPTGPLRRMPGLDGVWARRQPLTANLPMSTLKKAVRL